MDDCNMHDQLHDKILLQKLEQHFDTYSTNVLNNSFNSVSFDSVFDIVCLWFLSSSQQSTLKN